jgi:SWI/SNF-related matrix-associated actin-dependent regulator of chromatin subfamily A-like protein 1
MGMPVPAKPVPEGRKLQQTCKFCGGKARAEVSYKDDGDYRVHKLECGHSYYEKLLVEKSWFQEQFAKQTGLPVVPDSNVVPIEPWIKYKLKANSDKELRDYQARRVMDVIETANGRALLNSEMGLGKTPMSLCAVRSIGKEALPVLIFCKSKLKRQWLELAYEWIGQYPVQVIDSSREEPMPKVFPIIIVSLDLLRRVPWKDRVAVKTVIIDECQLIKNPDSDRTRAVRDICRRATKVIALSGTPIKNHAGEFFPILNILRPERFSNYAGFLRDHVETRWDGKKFRLGGLKNPERFRQLTQDFIFRDTRAQVAPELPEVAMNNRFVDMEQAVAEAYLKELEGFEQVMDAAEGRPTFAQWSSILGYMTRMRHLVGIAKIDATVDYVDEFYSESWFGPDATEGGPKKLTIFAHHKDVVNILTLKINKLLAEKGLKPAIVFTPEIGDKKIEEYVQNSSRNGWFSNDPLECVAIVSTLAGGEGLNLQQCADCVLAERQWNPANEKQAFDRFPRIGTKHRQINALILVAIHTIDEFLSRLVEFKREVVDATLDGVATKVEDSPLLRELADILRAKGRVGWSF